MTDCLFCKIANKELDADIIYEDDNCIAFNDINPKAPTHVLVIPKKHIATMNDISDDETELAGHLFQIAKKIAKDLDIAEAGYRVLMNCNQGGGQEVYHIHLHLLGGRQMTWPPG
jgi:histidine triad (HIT) family protein